MPERLLISLASALLLLLAIAAGALPARALDRIPVIASFSILGDIAGQVGGERVSVRTLIGPDGDAHAYQPVPADAKAVASARILVINGLGYEGWIGRLQRSSGFKGIAVTASHGITTRRPATRSHGHGKHDGHGHGHGAADPHAWQDVGNAKTYAANIRDALIEADPDGRTLYRMNAERYLAALDKLDAEVRAAITRLPEDRRKVITSHDAFGYFGAAYGIRFIGLQGISTESEASAADVARIIRQIRAEKVSAVFIENISDKRLLEQISRETGAKIGGALFSDALSGPDGPAPTYIEMIRHNTRTLTGALTP